MKRYQCPVCSAEIFFDSSNCLKCGSELGYLADSFSFVALNAGDAGHAPDGQYVLCQNAEYDVCNWAVPAASPKTHCKACSYNQTIPDLSQDGNLANWKSLELAKRHLFYSLMRWNLPLATKSEGDMGLAFEIMSDAELPSGKVKAVLTGHQNGVVTINVAEGDDALREKYRTEMGEPYRTLVGHFRHEIGHYYWDVLVASSADLLAEFRTLFGAETQNYADALKQHYENGAPDDWAENFISAYASSHPWEDFAETWAHYIHIVDGLETAYAYGMQLQELVGEELRTGIDFRPYQPRQFEDLVDAWAPLTVALNSLNRSIGQSDFYPFVINQPMLTKLRFVHDLVHGSNVDPHS